MPYIVVPIDGSELAAKALPYATLLAQTLKLKVRLTEAISPDTGRSSADAPLISGAPPNLSIEAEVAARVQRNAERQQEALASTQDRLALLGTQLAHANIEVETHVDLGSPRTVIAEASHHASFVVMSTHGRSGPSRWVIGSVAEQILRDIRVPALLLSERALRTGDASRLHQRVLVPLDGSELSGQVVPVVATLAKALGVPVSLLRVITPDTYFAGSVGLTYGAFPASDIMRDVESSAQNELTTIADPLRAQGLDVSVHAVTGRPIDSILSVQQELGAGWIAMGSHGRTGLGGLVLGGTAHGVLHHASTPVLIVTDATRKLR